jgi:hypothetical protein
MPTVCPETFCPSHLITQNCISRRESEMVRSQGSQNRFLVGRPLSVSVSISLPRANSARPLRGSRGAPTMGARLCMFGRVGGHTS